MLAEMLKIGGPAPEQTLLKLYNDVLKPNSEAPEQWRRTNIAVVYKAGDPSQPQNYRPIAIIIFLDKLISRLFHSRLAHQLDLQQPRDQAGFWHHSATGDHLLTLTMVQKKTQ
ncbi:unnamed protein product [Prorocentrum cordatum]|uniref:Reverse transcriptase domain-containing protein n=1 Tax=Prorocentrum cordatum TaxID=2364126 RepID=A0ABN9TDF4_9DINO|nr:unnamed protein product [Polarella glacialis]